MSRSNFIPQLDEERNNNSNIDEQLNDIIIQLKILNKYMSLGFDEVITEEDTE